MRYTRLHSLTLVLWSGTLLTPSSMVSAQYRTYDDRHLLDEHPSGKRFTDNNNYQTVGETSLNATVSVMEYSSEMPAPKREKVSVPRKRVSSKSTKSSKRNKSSKSSKSSTSRSSKAKGRTSKSSKGKGSGGGGKSDDSADLSSCASAVANTLLSNVVGIKVVNPSRCCNAHGPVAAFITHAKEDNGTDTGFEIFWDEMYHTVDMLSASVGTCFVFTGIMDSTTRTMAEIITDAISTSNLIHNIPAIMTTDPSDSNTVVETVRSVINMSNGANIGVWNAGYANIFLESVLSGQPLIPYVGYKSDEEYGLAAAQAIKLLLPQGTDVSPLCLNGRPNLAFIGERCDRFYFELGEPTSGPTTGVPCSSSSTEQEILDFIVGNGLSANAVIAHVDCCAATIGAVESARLLGHDIVAGCMDEDTTRGNADFVTLQSVNLQAYGAVTWVTRPLIVGASGNVNGRESQFFPSLDSHLDTVIFNQFTL